MKLYSIISNISRAPFSFLIAFEEEAPVQSNRLEEEAPVQKEAPFKSLDLNNIHNIYKLTNTICFETKKMYSIHRSKNKK